MPNAAEPRCPDCGTPAPLAYCPACGQVRHASHRSLRGIVAVLLVAMLVTAAIAFLVG